MRRCLFLLAVLLAFAAACDAPSGRAFSATFPEIELDPDFDVVMEAVPVTLYDATGLVVAMEILPPEPFPRPGPGIEVDPAAPRVAIIRWDGGSCLDQVSIAFSRVQPPGYAIEIAEQPPLFMLGCAGVGISRGIVVTLSEDVAPDDFLQSVDPT